MRLLVQMQPYLGQRHARIRKAGLQSPPVVHTGAELMFLDFAAAEQPQRRAVPAADKHARPALGRQTAPVPPVIRTFALLICFHPEHMVAYKLAVHPFRQQIDHRATPRTVDTRNDDQQGDSALPALTLGLKQAHAQLRRQLGVFLVAAAPTKGNGFKHGYSSGYVVIKHIRRAGSCLTVLLASSSGPRRFQKRLAPDRAGARPACRSFS